MSHTERRQPKPGPTLTPGAPGSSTQARPDRQMADREGLTTTQRHVLKNSANAKRRRRDKATEDE